MRIIYCSSPINTKIVDPCYEDEFDSAVKNGFEVALINFETLIIKNLATALKNLTPSANPEPAIFRGWMLNAENYALFYEGLKNKNLFLINNPEQYINCHYFPVSYDVIKEKTPKSIWFSLKDEFNFDSLFEKLAIFEGKPIIVKDYVKSQKHKWKDACFINSANDFSEVKRVVSNFITLQGDELNEGLVFREFCELTFIGDHSKSNMPLTKEYRLFFLNGKLLDKYNYWDEGEYNEEVINLDDFISIAKEIKSRFFSMDIAKTVAGNWILIELGDGQVAGLPDNADKNNFYNQIKLMH